MHKRCDTCRNINCKLYEYRQQTSHCYRSLFSRFIFLLFFPVLLPPFYTLRILVPFLHVSSLVFTNQLLLYMCWLEHIIITYTVLIGGQRYGRDEMILFEVSFTSKARRLFPFMCAFSRQLKLRKCHSNFFRVCSRRYLQQNTSSKPCLGVVATFAESDCQRRLQSGRMEQLSSHALNFRET